MRKIKVLHVTSTPGQLGGVERLLLDMAPHYDAARFSVSHCNLFGGTDGTGPFPRAIRAAGLPCFEIGARRWHELPKMVRALRALSTRQQIDILHLHMVHATIVGALANLLGKRAKVVVTKHYRYEMLSGALLGILDQTLTNRADVIVAVSRFISEDLVRHGAPGRKIRIIHNALDRERFDRKAAEPSPPLTAPADALVIACLGNLNPLKGHEYAIRAMPEIIRQFPSARLIVIGEGAERGRLEQLARSLGVDQAVSLPGYLNNLPAVLPRIDLCLHPSVNEAFGLVLLEAMAASKPVVASNIGGIPEIVVNGVTGLLVAPRDPAALASAVCSLLGNAGLRNRFGSEGRARVESVFDVCKTVLDYERLYSDLAATSL